MLLTRHPAGEANSVQQVDFSSIFYLIGLQTALNHGLLTNLLLFYLFRSAR